MSLTILPALKYFFYYKNRSSEAAIIGQVPMREYVEKLGQKNVMILEDNTCIRIFWENVCTSYVFKFSLNGEFQLIEREIWYEYTLPFLTKKIILEYNKSSN